jgi:tRNA pseudouridine38-40 synthase
MMDGGSAQQDFNRRRVAVLLEYNGAAYSGSQRQHQHGRVRQTVQHTLEEALRTLNIAFHSTHFSGRTDAGVHSRGQVVQVDLPEQALHNIPDLAASLNAVLPADVGVKAVCLDVPAAFHSQRSATHRWYRYTFYNRTERSIWAAPYSLHVRAPLNVDAMNRAAALLLGSHNFKSFKCPDTPILNDVCHVMHSRVHRDGELIHFDIVADRFIYKMVRNLTGLLLLIGKPENGLAPETMARVLDARERSIPVLNKPYPTARPDGLTLMAVNYPDRLNLFKEEPLVRQLQTLIHKPQLLTVESMEDENVLSQAS